jgi:hypothetical protein
MPQIKCIAFRHDRRGTLRGFAEILIEEFGLAIREIPVDQQGDKRWALLPARPRLTPDGMPSRDHKGKVVFEALLTIVDADKRRAFSDAVVNAVTAIVPAAFEEMAP